MLGGGRGDELREAMHLLLRGHGGTRVNKLPLLHKPLRGSVFCMEMGRRYLVLHAVVKVGQCVGDLMRREFMGETGGGERREGAGGGWGGQGLALRVSLLSKATFAFIF